MWVDWVIQWSQVVSVEVHWHVSSKSISILADWTLTRIHTKRFKLFGLFSGGKTHADNNDTIGSLFVFLWFVTMGILIKVIIQDKTVFWLRLLTLNTWVNVKVYEGREMVNMVKSSSNLFTQIFFEFSTSFISIFVIENNVSFSNLIITPII